MKLKPQTAILIVLAIFISGIVVTQLTGLWRTTAEKTATKQNRPVSAEQLPGQDGQTVDPNSLYDASVIRGSYTFGEISELYGIPLSELGAAFGIGENDTAAFKCKDLESLFGTAEVEIGVNSVKLFVAFYLGLRFETSEETWLPDTAAAILKAKDAMTAEQLNFLERHTFITAKKS